MEAHGGRGDIAPTHRGREIERVVLDGINWDWCGE
jgi:hypothetical protein